MNQLKQGGKPKCKRANMTALLDFFSQIGAYSMVPICRRKKKPPPDTNPSSSKKGAGFISMLHGDPVVSVETSFEKLKSTPDIPYATRLISSKGNIAKSRLCEQQNTIS